MWFIHKHVLVERLPQRRLVIRFEFPEKRKRLWWLILNKPDVDLCLSDEGPRELARAFPDWIGASHFVKYGQTASP